MPRRFAACPHAAATLFERQACATCGARHARDAALCIARECQRHAGKSARDATAQSAMSATRRKRSDARALDALRCRRHDAATPTLDTLR